MFYGTWLYMTFLFLIFKNEKPTHVSCIGHKYISSKPETAAF